MCEGPCPEQAWGLEVGFMLVGLKTFGEYDCLEGQLKAPQVGTLTAPVGTGKTFLLRVGSRWGADFSRACLACLCIQQLKASPVATLTAPAGTGKTGCLRQP